MVGVEKGQAIPPSILNLDVCFFFSSRRRHTRCSRDWSSDVCSSDLVQEEVKGSLEDIVAPPRGLKHRVLAGAKDEDVVDAMRGMLRVMARTGVGSFRDFREGGLPGVRLLLRAAIGGGVATTVLGRPARIEYRRDEVDAILRVAAGIGISSVLGW